jgi:metal-dependent amidase/aminoacylase/carboxypeptidase family protein
MQRGLEACFGISGSFQGKYGIAAKPSQGQECCPAVANMMQVMNAITPFMKQPRRSPTPAS